MDVNRMASTKNFLSTLLESLKARGSVVVATIAANKGSTPRTAGARMLIHADGSFAGTIGGGTVEAEVIRSAKDLFYSGGIKLLNFDLRSRVTAQGVDMICGGILDVMLEHLVADRETIGIFSKIQEVMRTGRNCFTIGELPPTGGQVGKRRRCVLQESGEMFGTCSLDAERLQSLMHDFADGSQTRLVEFGGARFMIEPYPAPASLYLFGAGHVSQQTASLASNVGFRTVVLDDRAEFANAGRFPAADEIHVLSSFEEPMDGITIDRQSYLVIVTRGHSHDKTVLAHALRTDACYIGMIGSRRKRDSIYDALRSEGFKQLDLDRVHSPIGLSIGAETPEEIAVSIVGELIEVRAALQHRQGSGK